jgi:hypothetical protein
MLDGESIMMGSEPLQINDLAFNSTDWNPPYEFYASPEIAWPNDGFLELSDLNSGLDGQALADCIESFKRHDLPRLPCIHITQDFLAAEALQYSMAALGAVHLEHHKTSANIFHEKAKAALSSSSV